MALHKIKVLKYSDMTTDEKINEIVQRRYNNYKAQAYRNLKPIHKIIKSLQGLEKFLKFLEGLEETLPKPVYQMPESIRRMLK